MENTQHATTNDMAEAATVFIEAYNHVLHNYIPEGRDAIKTFTADVLLKEKNYLLVTDEGASHISDIVFSHEVYRDFIFNLHYTFFARLGYNDKLIEGIIANVARGTSYMTQQANSWMPKDISNRLATEKKVFDLLLINKWLLIILLMQLFISAYPEIKENNKKA